MEALLAIVIVKDQQLKVYHDNSFHILLMCYIGSDIDNESTSSSNESHEVNGDTSNGEGSEGGENGDGDTPPNTTPAQGV